MSTPKKIIFGLFLLASLFLGFLGYKALKETKKPRTEALSFLPDSCLIYFSARDFHGLNTAMISQSLIFKKWQYLGAVKSMETVFNYYDSLIYGNEFLTELTRGNKIHFAIYANQTKPCWILAFNLKELGQEKTFKDLIDLISTPTNDISKSKRFNHYYRIINGAVLISDSPDLFDRASQRGHSLSENTEFIKLGESSNTHDHLCVYYDESLIRQNRVVLGFDPSTILSSKALKANIRFEPNEWIVSGNFLPDSNLIYKVISSQAPDVCKIGDLIPYSANYFRAIVIGIGKNFYKSLHENSEHQMNRFWNGINEKAMYNAGIEFYDNLFGFLGEFEWSGRNGLVMPISDTAKCDESLMMIASRDTVSGSNVYCLKNKKHSSDMFGGLITGDYKYIWRGTNALYFSNGPEDIAELRRLINSGANLSNKKSYNLYSAEQLNEPLHYLEYIEPLNDLERVKRFILYPGDKLKKGIQNLSEASLMVTYAKSAIQFRAHLNYHLPASETMQNALWQCALDTNIIGKPYLFKNHNTGDNELIVQDELNTLYLISSTGNIIWKKKINETLKSDIFMVDIFRNKKWQLLFNTDNYLHLIDRNGKYVQGYPVKLPAVASNEMTLADYDNDKNYRIFIACKNNQIYNYTLYGIKAEGYKPYHTEEEVNLPVKFVRVGLSDYLITIDKSGTIHAFSRKGDPRIGFKNKAIEGCNDFELVSTNNISSTYLCYVDEKNNLINKIMFDDKKSIVKLQENIEDGHACFTPVNDDKIADFVVISENGLKAFDINGYRLYQNEKINSQYLPEVVISNSIPTFYSYNQAAHLIQVCGPNGMPVKSIPSQSRPAIYKLFNDEKNYLIYVENGKLNCTLIK